MRRRSGCIRRRRWDNRTAPTLKPTRSMNELLRRIALRRRWPAIHQRHKGVAMLTRRKLIQAAGATAAGTLGGFDLAALAQEPLRIGFVYVSPVGEAGWTFQHDLGRKEMETALGAKVQTKFIESVSEGADAERVFRELASSGNRLIFGTSFGYMNYMEKVARQFPNITFEHATGYKTAKNLGVYNARF